MSPTITFICEIIILEYDFKMIDSSKNVCIDAEIFTVIHESHSMLLSLEG